MEYKSELTHFFHQFKRTHPQLDHEQQIGRAIWWDKAPLDLNERQLAQSAKIPPSSYVYYQDF